MVQRYTTREAAERLALEVCHVRRLLEQGKTKGEKSGWDWVALSLE